MAAAAEVGGDKYRSFIHGESERGTVWRYGAPPNYDVVNKLFEAERTQAGNYRDISSVCFTHGFRVARGVPGGEGAAAAQDLGDGARPQGAPRGPEDRQLRQVHRQHQRDEGPEPGGGDGHRRLQRLPAHQAAPRAPHLRPGRGDARLRHGHVPDGLPAGVRHRGARRLQRPAQDRLQVPALGVHGGPLQGPPAARPARRVRRRLHLPC